MDRRKFLIGCGAGAAYLATSKLSFALSPLGLNATTAGDKILITIFLRGGCDGLNFLAPSSNAIYNDLRGMGIKVSDSGLNKGLEIKGSYTGEQFFLHPDAPELNEIYQSDEIAFIHACGLPNGTRSHFVAQDLIERGIVKNNKTRDGWMARYLNEMSDSKAVIKGASLGGVMAESLIGCMDSASISSLEEFELVEGINDHELFRKWYGGTSYMDETAKQTLDAIEFVRDNSHKYRPEATYPGGYQYEELNNSLQNLAALIKMDTGIKAANVDFGGWDHHERQGMLFPKLVKNLSKSVTAFYQDIDAYKDKVTIVVMSEFGRRLKSNGSLGTDHGYGSLMMVMGGKVNGGKMYGKWPGLEEENLNRGVDLEVTTDYRQVLAELTGGNQLFPGLSDYSKFGLLRD